MTWFLLILCIVAGLWANNRGIIGLFPVIASAEYTLLMYITKNEQQMRWALMINLFLWLIHDFYVQAYPSAITDLALGIWIFVQIYCNKKKS